LQTDDETKKRAQVAGEPILALNEKVVRDEIGVQHFVILDELSKVQFQILRDEIRTQLWKNLQEKGKNLVSFHDTR
jgi:hypothetical protein